MTKPKPQIQVPSTLAIFVGDCDLFELSEDGEPKPLNKARKKELLREVRQGEPHELMVDAMVYQQSTTPRPLPHASAGEANYNYFFFKPSILASLAKSFRGKAIRKPFLRDHDRMHLDAVGGEIASSELVEENGWLQIRQSLRLISRWAVEAALEGTLRTFSIGWEVKKRGRDAQQNALYCTVCGKKMMSSDCPHLPGDTAELDDQGNRAIVELEWRSAIGAETSAVSFPAVAGTEVESIRAALAASRAEIIKEPQPMTDQERAELEAKTAEIEKYKTELAAAEVARDSAITSLDAERAKAQDEADKRGHARIHILREDAYKRGLMAKDDASDKLFAELAANDIDQAERFIGTLRPGATQAGAKMQSEDDDAINRTEPPANKKMAKILAEEYLEDNASLHVPVLESQLKQLGLTAEDFVKYGQHTRYEEN